MKNFWIKKRQESLQKLAAGFTLDTYYSFQYVQGQETRLGEITDRDKGGLKTYIVPNTVVGEYKGQVFQDDGKGRLKMSDGKLLGMIHYDFGIITSHIQGTVIVSYEYDYSKDGTL